MIKLPVTTPSAALTQLLDVILFLSAQGWTPATSSNFSLKVAEADTVFWISRSGLDKATLTPQDFIPVDCSKWTAVAEGFGKPSAETPLHALIYQTFPGINTVLHTHSLSATVLSRLVEPGTQICFDGYEIAKAFSGVSTHEQRIILPIFENSQDMAALHDEVALFFAQNQTLSPLFGFVLRGHGLYTWGDSPAAARRHLEAFEFLMAADLAARSVRERP